mgnify:CR=1 FL=1
MNVGTAALRARRLLAAVVFLGASVFVTNVSAQSSGETREAAEISDRQIELNEEGVRAIISGDHEKAVAVLSESLAYGEANATYLNLGRAYQKLGNCKEARKALEKALTAPVVDDPPPRVIDKKANQYLAELDEACAKDQPPEAEKDAKADADEGERETEETVEKAEREAEETEDTAEKTAEKAEDTGEDDDSLEDPGPPPESKSGNGLAIASIGAGVAFVGAGVTMHVLASQERLPVYEANEDPDQTVVPFNDQRAAEIEQRANTYDTIGLSANIAGGALIGVGVILLLTDSGTSETSSIHVTPTRDGAAASFRLQF